MKQTEKALSNKETTIDNRWLSITEIASYLGISKDTAYTWVNERGLPGYKVGRLWKFKQADVDCWVRANKTTSI
jgi:excisionase family DNA binding protein